MVAIATTTESEVRAEAMTWVCYWDYIYGIYPPEKAIRPDSEEPVITQEGHKICERCYQKWLSAREQAEREAEAAKARAEGCEQ